MKSELLALVERALSTPLLEATAALDVLTDALLEAGEIGTEDSPGPVAPHPVLDYAPLVSSPRDAIRQNAIVWARGCALLWHDARLVARPTLPPCEVTGRPCAWRSREWFDGEGEMVGWDDFCEDCGQLRDFGKDVCPDPIEVALDRSSAEREP